MNLYLSRDEIKTLIETGVTPELLDKLQIALELYPQFQGIGEQAISAGSAKSDEEYNAAVESTKNRLDALGADLRHYGSRGRLVMVEWLRFHFLADFMDGM